MPHRHSLPVSVVQGAPRAAEQKRRKTKATSMCRSAARPCSKQSTHLLLLLLYFCFIFIFPLELCRVFFRGVSQQATRGVQKKKKTNGLFLSFLRLFYSP
jgi:hypothetical protein